MRNLHLHRIVYIKQQMMPLVVDKDIQIPPDTTVITLQPRNSTTSFETRFACHGKTLIFVGPLEKYSAFSLIIVHFEANKCIFTVKNMQNSVVSISPGQTIAYLDCRSKGCSLPRYSVADISSLQYQLYLPERMLHDTLSPESCKKVDM